MWPSGLIPLVLLVVVLPAVPVFGQKIPCPQVLRELHRVERLGGLRGGDPGRVAKSLGTTAGWVERCAEVYGRRLQARGAPQRRAQQEARWESDELEEVTAEELETENDVVLDPAPYRDKVRQRDFTRQAEDWEPYTRGAWKPSSGKQWSPYLIDPHRAMPSDVPGLVDR